MRIYYKRKLLAEINSSEDLSEFFLKEKLYKFFKKIPDNAVDKINSAIINTNEISYKNIKPWFKSILNYPESIYNKNFLLCMGWELNDVNEFIRNRQTLNSKILSKNKRDIPEKYYDKTPTRIEYWIKKGYSLDDAKIKLSNRQTTFSKEICIEKYGKKKGLEIFKKRQKKWINTLKNKAEYDEIQKKKNTYNYDSDIKLLVKRTSFLEETKRNIIECLDCDNINIFVDCILNVIDVKSYSDIYPYINSNIIQNHYNATYEEIRNLFYEKTFYSITTQTYGIPVYHNGIRFKSIKEYEIALLLEKNGINYVYEINYPNSRFKCDFYLPELDIYIEYYGLLDGKQENSYNEIHKTYFKKMIEKNLFCKENNINLLSDISFENIKNKIKNIL